MSAASVSTSFEDAFLASPNQMGFAVVTLLAWIATSDGHLAPEEENALRHIARSAKTPTDVDLVLRIIRQPVASDLQLACEVVRHMATPQRRLLLQMAIGVALEDRLLKPAEGHILRFLADVLDLGANGFRLAFNQVTGRDPPAATDASDPKYWEPYGEQSKQHSSGASSSSTSMNRMKALAILGLDDDANEADIKLAFRRLAKIHHPDRFMSLGPEAVQAATRTFQRVKSAYDYLAR
jgi:uncharacterized tellurite resistance protein B-like protein